MAKQIHDDARLQSTAAALGWTAAGAAALAGAFAFNRWSQARSEDETPPPGQFIEVDGTRLHYLDEGSGPPIVLIHGNGSLVQDFVVSGLVDRLATRHRVIAFDRPGYGYSSRPRGADWSPERQAKLFTKACQSLGVERPLVVGHSWGTLPALAWALDYPDRVAGIVLVSGYHFGSPRIDAVMTGVAAMPVVGDLYTQTLLPLQSRVTGPLGLKMIFSPVQVPQHFLDTMPFGLMLRPSQLHATAADGAQMPIATARLAERYGELTLPVAIVWGQGDKLVPPAGQSERLAEVLPHAKPVPIADAGHMVHHTHLDRVTTAITDLAAEALV